MPRSIVFGNQSLLIGLDCDYNIRDLYYPYVGMENHVNGHKCRVGLSIDGQFSWLESDNWIKKIKYMKNTLVGDSVFINHNFSIKLTIKDCVHNEKNIFLRIIKIENNSEKNRKIKIFFSQDFQIYGTDVGITAYYDTKTKSVIHYLKDRWFLINGGGDNEFIDSFSTGKSHFGKSEGTYKDAEDGILEENPIEQGSVDSVIQLNVNIKAKDNSNARYWIVIGEDYDEIKRLNDFLIKKGIKKAIMEVNVFDKTWANNSKLKFFDLHDDITNLFKQSLLIVRSQMDKNGAILAANDSDILQFNKDHYSYMWPRDGALVALALDKAKYFFLTKKFFLFCKDVITQSGYLLHKYNPDGSIGSSWHPWFQKDIGYSLAIQEDETALCLYSLWKHFEEDNDLGLILDLYKSLIIPASEFLLEFRNDKNLPRPSYDLWEERYGIHTFTVCSVYAGLIAAGNFAKLFENNEKMEEYFNAAESMKKALVEFLFDEDADRFIRSIVFKNDGTIEKDSTIDASLFALFQFEVFSSLDPRVISTMEQIRKRLWVKTECGGLARYENDYYHRISDDIDKIPGNPWYICTLWLAEWYIRKAIEGDNEKENMEKAKELMKWVTNHSLKSKIIAEQVNPFTSEPISVSPLTWSHATFIMTVMEYLEGYSISNKCSSCGRALDIFEMKKLHRNEI